MRRDVRHPILLRLLCALEAKGANLAARHLKKAQPLLAGHIEENIRCLALRHCRTHGLDPEWILRGQGVPGDAARPPEFTPVFAMASIHPLTGRWRLKEVERIPLAPDLLSPTRFVTRMDSRALEPSIRLGAYLMVDMAQEFVPAATFDPDLPPAQASAFAVEVRGEGLAVRLALYDGRRNRLELQALPATGPQFSVPAGSPDCRVVGRVVWMAQDL